MKNNFYRVVFIAGLFFGSCFAPCPVPAQTAPIQAASPQTAAEKDPFADDPRLQQIIDYRCEEKRISDVLTDLSERYRFRYNAEYLPASGEDRYVTLHFTQQPLKTVLASLPPFCESKAKWTRDDKTLVLLQPGADYSDDWRPVTQAQADTQAQGRAFLDIAAKLTPELQQRLKKGAAGNVRLEELPQDAQQTLRSLYKANGRQMSEEKWPDWLMDWALKEDITGCGVFFELKENSNEAAKRYDIEFKFDGENNGQDAYVPVRINRLTDPKEDYHVVPHSVHANDDEVEAARVYKDCLDSQEQALGQDARLMRRVSLTLDRVTLTQAIQNVARLADIPTAAHYLSFTETHSFKFQNVLLKDVLSQVLAAYKHHAVQPEWTMRGADSNPLTMERNGDTVTFRDAKGNIVAKEASPKPRGYTTQYVWGWQKSGVFLFREHSEYDSKDVAAAPAAKKP